MDPKQGVKQIHINGDAIPGRGEDDLLTLLAMQVLDATKINTHTDADKAQRYNAAIAALHDIAPVGALEGMLATQLIATHMATMDCYKHINATNDRNTHASHLNHVNKLSAPTSLCWRPSIVTVARASRRSRSSTCMCIKVAKLLLGTLSTKGVGWR
jgi:hypothetical protein